MKYAELNCLSNFSFLKGASHPEELIQVAVRNNYYAIALTDECSLSGVVRAYEEAKQHSMKLIVGTAITVFEGTNLVLLANTLTAYKEISRLISLGRSRQAKGDYLIFLKDLMRLRHSLVIVKTIEKDINKKLLGWFKDHFSNRLWIGVGNFYGGKDQMLYEEMCVKAKHFGVPMTAIGDVRMHEYGRRFLLDTITAIRHKTTVDEIGIRNFCNAERYLRPLRRIQHLYPRQILEETIKIADQCEFDLSQIHCEYPKKIIPNNHDPTSYLRSLTEKGMRKRWPFEVPPKVRELVEHELTLIKDLGYEGFFLTVENIVSFAKSRGILCQGRGSAANSAVCYCLGVTEVDPSAMEMLFERFISKERDEPPDIDVDFEHERREEVVQYVYSRYGRKYAALASTVVTYKKKSAVRDVGKALGYQSHEIKSLLRDKEFWETEGLKSTLLPIEKDQENVSRLKMFTERVKELIGFPRHLSQHVGGFVISDKEISEMVPTENASMPGRTVIQWDKNDLESMGILKFDCLALGMLTAIRKSFELMERFNGQRYEISDVPSGDGETYHMIQKGDTVGVFQIESRAQMAMLPRLKPKCFYDLVIEIAIIRPGPIQGDMVHPYLRRRRGEEQFSYPSEEVKSVLKRTLGVPLFQEQVIKLAVVAAGFSAGEAEVLRRSITSWNQDNVIDKFRQRLINGMALKGYDKHYAETIFEQIRGFGKYGFPESHAASFALLAYVSSWLKCHQPAAFTAALLNSQPMGFYSAAQLIRDAVAHGVEIRPFDIIKSDWDSTLEVNNYGKAVIRLGLRLIRGLGEKYVSQLVCARRQKPFHKIDDVINLSFNSVDKMVILAYAGALRSLVGNNRYQAVWKSILPKKGRILKKSVIPEEALPMLRRPTEVDDVLIDYSTANFTLGRHPINFLRNKEQFKFHVTANCLQTIQHDTIVNVIGLVISRQRPQTAAGVVFVTIEDESGFINLIVWPDLVQDFEGILINSKILGVRGKVQKDGMVVHVVAQSLCDHSSMVQSLNASSRDFK